MNRSIQGKEERKEFCVLSVRNPKEASLVGALRGRGMLSDEEERRRERPFRPLEKDQQLQETQKTAAAPSPIQQGKGD